MKHLMQILLNGKKERLKFLPKEPLRFKWWLFSGSNKDCLAATKLTYSSINSHELRNYFF